MSTKTLSAAAAVPAWLADMTATCIGTSEPGEDVSARIEQLRVGDYARVHAFGAWRRGVVVKLTRTRATVAYRTPSNPTLVRIATTATPRVGRYFFANHPERAS